MFAHLRTAALLLAVFTLLTGVAYPLLITGIAQAVFPNEANGSLIVRDGVTVGSSLIGQKFTGNEYFWSRPSATGPAEYNGGASSGSNLGPSNSVLHDAIAQRVSALRAADSSNTVPVPVDLVTASGSGLDPHISVAAALYQAGRVARNRGVTESTVRALIDEHTQGRWLGVFGEPRVNVLELNLALEAARPAGGR